MAVHRNLLLVFAHGLRSDAISDHRRWPLQTTHLEALAGRGVRLVASSACPAKPGGMISLLTGLHARQHGYTSETAMPQLSTGVPHWLAEAGYHVAGVGCVRPFAAQLDHAVVVDDVAEAEPAGCAYWSAASEQGIGDALAQQRRQRQRTGPFAPDRLLLEPEDDIDGFISRQALATLDQMPEDKPWAMIVCYSGPGNDLPPPTLYEGVVDHVELQHGFIPADLRAMDVLVEPTYPRIMLQRLEPHAIGKIRADYLGRVSLIDVGVGQLDKRAQQRQDAAKTWTVVASDHGYLLGEHGLVGRRSFLAGTLETPVIIAPPANKPFACEELWDGLVSTVDVAATIGALGGCDMPAASVGRSLLPIFAGQPVTPDLAGGVLSEFNDRLMLETQRYKAVFDRVTRQCIGLFDLLKDADERENIMGTPRGKSLTDALRWRVADAVMPLRSMRVE